MLSSSRQKSCKAIAILNLSSFFENKPFYSFVKEGQYASYFAIKASVMCFCDCNVTTCIFHVEDLIMVMLMLQDKIKCGVCVKFKPLRRHHIPQSNISFLTSSPQALKSNRKTSIPTVSLVVSVTQPSHDEAGVKMTACQGPDFSHSTASARTRRRRKQSLTL